MSDQHITVTVPDALVAVLADAVAELVAERNGNGAAADPWLSVDQAAEHAACSKARVYDWIRHGALPVGRDGRRVVIRRSAIDHYLGGAQ